MRKIFTVSILFFVTLTAIFVASCNSKPYNPNAPVININCSIYPNSLEYQELNTVGGWMYITAQLPSYGIIVYRYNIDEFKAYERKAPNEPYACPDNRLFVDLPFVVDSCMKYKYSILDGSLIEGTGYNLIEYFTEFDGTELRIYN